MTPGPDAAPAGDPGTIAFMRERRYARACALRFLYQLEVSGTWEMPAAESGQFWQQMAAFDDAPLETEFARARGFAETVVAGVLAHREAIDATLTAAAANWSLARMGAVDRNLLRLAAFELLYNPEMPGIAAINEAIELAKEYGDKDSGRFVNGILDRLLKDKEPQRDPG